MSASIKKWLLGGVAAGLMVPVLPAMAQESQGKVAAAQADDSEVISEVVITARRREESILKVPVVANVIEAKQLDQYAAGDLAGISNHVPGLNLGAAVSSFGNQVSLRGVGTSTMNATIDQSVSLNIDGMQMTQGLAYSMGFFDMAHVEVLKGPQALFFGKASPAGVISVRSADPTNEFEAVLRASYEFEAKEKQTEFVVSGPLTDTLRARLAGSYSDAEGFFKNKGSASNLGALAGPFAAFGPLGSFGGANPTSRRVADTQNTMLRGTVIWDPNDQFRARLKVNYAKLDVEGAGFDAQLASCPDGVAPTNAFRVPFLGNGEDCHLDRTTYVTAVDPAAFPRVYNGGVPFNASEQAFGTLELTYRIDPSLTLSSVTGYYNLEQSQSTNGGAGSAAGPAFVVQGDYSRRDFTQEVRLTSDFDGPLDFMVGGFYQEGKQGFLVDLPANQRLGELLGFAANLPASLRNPHGFQAFPPTLAYGDHTVDTESTSVFGQVLYKLRPDLELGVGARWTEEERRHTQISLFPVPRVSILGNPRIESSNWSPELSLTYTPTDELTFFGSLRQAYKSGSFITSGVFSDGDNTAFGDERVRGGEIGMKSVLLDRSLQLNLAGYYYEYRGLQIGSNEITPVGNVAIYTRNAAGAESYGVDFDSVYKSPAIDGLTLNAAANWNISEYTDFDDAPCWGGQTYAQGCNLLPRAAANAGRGGYTAQDLSGGSLMRAPKWSVNLGADYERPFGDGMTLALGVSTQYTVDYYTNILLRDDMRQDGFFKTSASIAIRGPNNAWEFALIGNNLGNEIVAGNCVNSNVQDSTSRVSGSVTGRGGGVYPAIANPAGVEELLCTVEPGRSVRVRFTVRPSELMR